MAILGMVVNLRTFNGNEHGHQAWLSEPRPPGVFSFFNRLDTKASQAAYTAGKKPVPARQKSAAKQRRK